MDATVSADELAEVMAELGMSSDDAPSYREVVEGSLGAIGVVDSLLPPDTPVEDRLWHRPTDADNELGAWYVRTDFSASENGPLAGKSVAIKDNIAVAGVPMMNGTSILEGYTPAEDAEVVTRLLGAGATIAGKAVCEAYCFSGGSHTSATGPVHNPHNRAHSAGGSSSGSAALVAAGEVDFALGCDQGGSIRMPASFCGIVGMKPTHGLVPYTGILGMSPTIDHVGPMTSNVADNALLLEVLAGPDGIDSRQRSHQPSEYTDALGARDLSDLRIGLVREGFGLPDSEPDVDDKVRAAANQLAALGASVSELSIPIHLVAGAIGFARTQATLTSMFHLDGCLIERPDPIDPAYVQHQSAWRDRADELPPNVKTMLIVGEILRRRHGYTYVPQSGRFQPSVRAAYDDALEHHDILLMPTTPMKAPPLPAPDADPAVVVGAAFAPLANTSVFNATHHPALSIPCGLSDGLPVGMMLVGRHFEETSLYQAAHAFEQSNDWQDS